MKNCRASIPTHGKLLVFDAVLDTDNAPNPAKFLDLDLMVEIQGRERTEQEFRKLFKASDFELKQVIPLPGAIAIIEAEPI